MRSSIWTLAGHSNDAYFGARVMGGVYKFSFHGSGTWRLATPQETPLAAPLMEGDGRVILKWERPAPFTAGWTRACDIIIPGRPVRSPFRQLDGKTRPVDWFGPPDTDAKLVFTVLVSAAEVPAGDWERPCRGGDLTAGHIQLANGERVWVMARYDAMSAEEVAFVRGFDDMRFDYEDDPGELSASIHVLPTEGKPTVMELMLGWENVYVGGVRCRPGG